MAITAQLVGRLGSQVSSTQVASKTYSGSSGSNVAGETVTVPAGETWLVVWQLSCNGVTSTSAGSLPQLYIGSTLGHPFYTGSSTRTVAMARELTAGTYALGVRLNSSTSGYHPAGSGTVYTVRMA